MRSKDILLTSASLAQHITISSIGFELDPTYSLKNINKFNYLLKSQGFRTDRVRIMWVSNPSEGSFIPLLQQKDLIDLSRGEVVEAVREGVCQVRVRKSGDGVTCAVA